MSVDLAAPQAAYTAALPRCENAVATTHDELATSGSYAHCGQAARYRQWDAVTGKWHFRCAACAAPGVHAVSGFITRPIGREANEND